MHGKSNIKANEEVNENSHISSTLVSGNRKTKFHQHMHIFNKIYAPHLKT